MPPRTIEEYVHWVLSEDKALAKVDPEVKKQLEADYVRALEDEITAAMVSELSEDQMALAEKMLEHDSVAHLQDWLQKQVPNVEDIIAGVLLRFRTNYLSANDVG